MNVPVHTREFEFWTPEQIWKGEQAFVLASGPSLTQETVDKVKGRHTIVVNSSCMLAPWAEILYFTDGGWYEQYSDVVANWPGMIVSMSRAAKREHPNKVKRVQGEMRPDFPRFGAPVIRQGRSSGHSAVSLAISLGAAQTVMLGFDMRIVNGREHHHQDYKGPRDLDQYAREFVPAFKGWNADALAFGAEIVNATPGSAVTEFPFVDLDEVLTCAKS